MPGISYEEQTKIRETISAYLDRNGVTTLEAIADYVAQQTGLRPSLGTVSRHIKKAGYERPSWKRKDSP